MDKIYLITDITTSFALKVAKGLLERDNIIIGLNSSFENQLFNQGKKNKNFHILNWNPSSPLSASKVVKECINKFGKIDQILLILSPTGDDTKFEKSSKVSIEEKVDSKIKGIFYILNEIINAFLKSDDGNIFIINDKTGAKISSPIDYVITEMGKSITKSLIDNYQDKNFSIDFLDSQDMIDSEFSSYTLKALGDKSREKNKIFEVEKEEKKKGWFFKK